MNNNLEKLPHSEENFLESSENGSLELLQELSPTLSPKEIEEKLEKMLQSGDISPAENPDSSL